MEKTHQRGRSVQATSRALAGANHVLLRLVQMVDEITLEVEVSLNEAGRSKGQPLRQTDIRGNIFMVESQVRYCQITVSAIAYWCSRSRGSATWYFRHSRCSGLHTVSQEWPRENMFRGRTVGSWDVGDITRFVCKCVGIA